MKKVTTLILDRFEVFWVLTTVIGKMSTTNITDTDIIIKVPSVVDLLMSCPAGLDPPLISCILRDNSLQMIAAFVIIKMVNGPKK